MGLMGRYLAALDDEGRDRVVRGQGWTIGMLSDPHDNHCLIGHARGCEWGVSYPNTVSVDVQGLIGTRFNDAAFKFGLPRVVRALKIRAARLNGCSPEEIRALVEPEPSSVPETVR